MNFTDRRARTCRPRIPVARFNSFIYCKERLPRDSVEIPLRRSGLPDGEKLKMVLGERTVVCIPRRHEKNDNI